MRQQQCDGNGQSTTCKMLATDVPRIRGNNQLMSTVWGGVEEGEGQFRGGEMTEKGRDGGDWVEIALSLLNRFQTYLPATPGRQEKDWNLFRMFPGSEAALSVPLWACLMMMKKWTVRWQLVSCLGGGIWATWLVLHFYKVLIKITKANHIRFSVTQNY